MHLQIDSLVLANLRARVEGNFRGWIIGDDDKRQVTEIAGGADLRGTDICKTLLFLERGPKAAATVLRMKFTAAQQASDAKGGQPSIPGLANHEVVAIFVCGRGLSSVLIGTRDVEEQKTREFAGKLVREDTASYPAME
jgi:hypothetical protein